MALFSCAFTSLIGAVTARVVMLGEARFVVIEKGDFSADNLIPEEESDLDQIDVYQVLEDERFRHLGRKVEHVRNGTRRGVLELSTYTEADLDLVYKVLNVTRSTESYITTGDAYAQTIELAVKSLTGREPKRIASEGELQTYGDFRRAEDKENEENKLIDDKPTLGADPLVVETEDGGESDAPLVFAPPRADPQ